MRIEIPYRTKNRKLGKVITEFKIEDCHVVDDIVIPDSILYHIEKKHNLSELQVLYLVEKATASKRTLELEENEDREYSIRKSGRKFKITENRMNKYFFVGEACYRMILREIAYEGIKLNVLVTLFKSEEDQRFKNSRNFIKKHKLVKKNNIGNKTIDKILVDVAEKAQEDFKNKFLNKKISNKKEKFDFFDEIIEGRYKIDLENGEVISLKTGRPLYSITNNQKKTVLSYIGKKYTYTIASVIAYKSGMFDDIPENEWDDYFVTVKDGDIENTKPSNLIVENIKNLPKFSRKKINKKRYKITKKELKFLLEGYYKKNMTPSELRGLFENEFNKEIKPQLIKKYVYGDIPKAYKGTREEIEEELGITH